MRYVWRDEDGNIKGSYAEPQPGIAEEEMADDAPELKAFTERRSSQEGEPE